MKQSDRKVGKMRLYSANWGVLIVSKNKQTGIGIEGDTWITRQTVLLNCARVGRVGILAGRAFQWLIVLGKNVNIL